MRLDPKRIGAVLFLVLAIGFLGLRLHAELAGEVVPAAGDVAAAVRDEGTESLEVSEKPDETAPVTIAASIQPAGGRPVRNPFRRPARPVVVRETLPPLPVLQGIRGGGVPVAWLNGEAVRVGQVVDRWMVQAIRDDQVVLVAPSGAVRTLEAR